MKDNLIVSKSFSFSISIVNLYKYLCEDKKEYVLSKQLLRSGTSIGANVREAIQGQSKKDFLSKMNIALKEASETEYWIELLIATNYLDETNGRSILDNCIEIKKILHSIVKTTKNNS
ncbi:MAG: four helix bundle protein [Lutispora sp.]|nr:four helix bundle protein [Lutispora sp.]